MHAQRPTKEKFILSVFIPLVVFMMLYLVITFHTTVLKHFTPTPIVNLNHFIPNL